MGLRDAIRFARSKRVQDNTTARKLGKGDHFENCERCKHSTSNSRSPTGLTCVRYSSHVPANGKCGDFTR